MKNSDNQKIVFSEDTSIVISEILKKYNLQETDEELDEKLTADDLSLPMGGIVLDLTMDVVEGKTQTKDMSVLLQKELKIPKQIAEALAKDIEEKLIATSKKISLEEWKRGRFEDTVYLEEEPEEPSILEIVVELPENKTNQIIAKILKDNGIEELESSDKELPSQIIKDATATMVRNVIPEEKITELLAEHLEVPKENAAKVMGEIKQKLIPYAKIVDEDQGEVVQKISKPESAVNTNNEVEKVKTVLPQEEKKGPDEYREPIE